MTNLCSIFRADAERPSLPKFVGEPMKHLRSCEPTVYLRIGEPGSLGHARMVPRTPLGTHAGKAFRRSLGWGR
jgi:hypothetical protein